MESHPSLSLDGSSDDRVPDVLDSGSDREPRFTPVARRRLRLGVVVAVLAVAAVTGGLEVQERRHAAAEERRLAGLLQLSASGAPWQSFVAADLASSDSFDVNMRIPIRNDGPRDVTVTHASAGGFALLLAPVPLPAQTTNDLVLQQKVQCAPDTAPPLQAPPDGLGAPGPLQVTATTSRGSRTITIEQPPYDLELAARFCELLRQGPPPPG